MPFAHASPIRSPVNEPGPWDTATPERSRKFRFCSRRRLSATRESPLECSPGSSVPHADAVPSTASATEPKRLAVSTPRIVRIAPVLLIQLPFLDEGAPALSPRVDPNLAGRFACVAKAQIEPLRREPVGCLVRTFHEHDRAPVREVLDSERVPLARSLQAVKV